MSYEFIPKEKRFTKRLSKDIEDFCQAYNFTYSISPQGNPVASGREQLHHLQKLINSFSRADSKCRIKLI